MITTERLKRRLRLRDLDTLMAVVQAGGMRKAADALHMSQGAVSKAIAELESVLGVRLLERTAKGVEPTLYGRALLRRGRVIFDELRQGVSEINHLAEPGVGELALGVGESLAASVVPAVIDRVHRLHPRITFKVESGDPPVLLDHFLRQRHCELVMLRPWQAITDPDIDSEPLFNERIAVVAGQQSEWARRRKLTLAQLMDEPWILSHVEAREGSPLQRALAANGLPLPPRLMLSGSLNLRYSLLATQRYLTLMPMTILRLCPGRGAVKALPLQLPSWELPTVMATLRGRELSPVGQLFREQAREVAALLA
ncbi:MAG TPA: LysR family transcriptional regulator [Methylibium sp.]|nr:LysR family transcriptional regulator [Methylibium sp.]